MALTWRGRLAFAPATPEVSAVSLDDQIGAPSILPSSVLPLGLRVEREVVDAACDVGHGNGAEEVERHVIALRSRGAGRRG